MTITQRAGKYLGGIAFGVAAAWFLSQFVARFWPGSQLTVFIVLVVIWLSGFAQILVRDIRAGHETERAVFARAKEWRAEELPQEFRFITRDTTIQQVVDTVGPYTRVTEAGLIRYDLPVRRRNFSLSGVALRSYEQDSRHSALPHRRCRSRFLVTQSSNQSLEPTAGRSDI